jgi:hypothetical protein
MNTLQNKVALIAGSVKYFKNQLASSKYLRA